MNLDELRSVQNRERQTDSLQHLRESFYEEVGTYIADLKTERERAAEAADDPWSDPDVQRLTDEIETAEEVAESVYERRMGKLVKDASLAAAGYATDTEGLTLEEERLFQDLVDRIESNKSAVLDVLAGEAVSAAVGGDADEQTDAVEPASGTAVTDPQGADPAGNAAGIDHASDPNGADPEGVDPASLMGADGAAPTDPVTSEEAAGVEQPDASTPTDDPLVSDDAATESVSPDAPPKHPPSEDGSGEPVPPEIRSETEQSGTESTGNADNTGGEPTAGTGSETTGESPAGEQESSGLDDRRTVRITSDIGSILGVDDHEYELSSHDVVTLPEENAEPLIERDAAEPID